MGHHWEEINCIMIGKVNTYRREHTCCLRGKGVLDSLWILGVGYVSSLLRDNVAASVLGQVSLRKSIGTN